MQDLAYFSQVFLKFAERECKGSSALYGHLSKEIAKDEFILELSMKRREGQPAPNLLFGAVHYDNPLYFSYPCSKPNVTGKTESAS